MESNRSLSGFIKLCSLLNKYQIPYYYIRCPEIIQTTLSKVITGGINLVYYSEPSIKMSFLENLLLEFSEKNILVVDFDTQFTNRRDSLYGGSKFMKLENTEVFLPYEVAFEEVVDKFMDYDERDSVLVIDSLNGLLDYFGSYKYGYDDGLNNYYKRDHKEEKNKETNKDAGYKGLCLLKILLQSHSIQNVPTVLTSYASQRGLDQLIADLLLWEENLITDLNHFRRFSNSISCLGHHQFDSNFFVTILKKKPRNITKSSSHQKVHAHSIIVKDNLG